MLQYLLEVGCNYMEPDDTKKLPLHWAAGKIISRVFKTNMNQVNGNSACISLLSEKKTDLNWKDDDGATALHFATQKNHIDCAIILIKRGANPDTCDSLGRSPLLWAVYAGNPFYYQQII